MSYAGENLVGWLVPRWQTRSFPVGFVAVAKRQAAPILLSFALTGAVTLCLFGLGTVVTLDDISVVYLIPVLISAACWGVVPGITAALAGVAAAMFFFYPPLYSFHVSDPQQIVNLALFLVVALVTSQLAANVQRRERELRALYAFSRRLAIAPGPPDIYAAIQDHLRLVLGRRVALFETTSAAHSTEEHGKDLEVPARVREAISAAMRSGAARDEIAILDQPSGMSWLIRPVLKQLPALGMVAIELGHATEGALGRVRERIAAVLSDAAATLERLDVARALGEAKMRSEAETFRDALIGSVSHELRTPLASIVSSTYVLVNAPGIKQDVRLAALAEDLRHEADRLNDDIQNLLDASRITGAGVRPHLQWADVTDIINAAVDRRQRRLAEHHLEFEVPDDLPLVHADPLLIEQALGQILDNAAKYSPPGSLVRVAAKSRGDEVVIAVSDQGFGLTAEDLTLIWERFYRSPRHQTATAGSGLGLWIARAFVLANGGRIEAKSDGPGRGTTLTILLPAPAPATADEEDDPNE